ncbi:MAG: ABC transporter substrate-binding protein [Lentisphaerae bacterium]|jgi:branched-chain amino acid transport system substrate-binding protein|nr:ABC transporter substrate-binding protein [Victivallaceae bacterium]MDD3703822.1 ABC transporter substrate-binding protein [Victivallaceae bacterium]MDD5663849.1 ABC transporter substrate-binding protein [Victivallaceae bacterium]NLK82591.1 ABC transporter substrate-binding protein [Lentisphaerota bacterium]
MRFIFVLPLLLISVGCSFFDSRPEIVVGVNLPLSGAHADYGQRLLAGIELKCSELNQSAKPDAAKISLRVLDNQSTLAGTAKATKTLASWHKVPLIIGAYSSSSTFAMRPEAEKYQVPVITPTATSGNLTVGNKFMFRTCFADNMQGKYLGVYAYQCLEMRKIAILVDADEESAQNRYLGFDVKKSFADCGGEVVLIDGFYNHEATFNRQLRRIVQADVDGICFLAEATEAVRFIKEARIFGFNGYIFGGDGWDEENIYTDIGANPGKCFYFGMFSPEYESDGVKEFVENIMNITARVPAACEAQGYDTLGLAVKALQSGLKGEELAQEILNIKNYQGVSGTISMRSDQNADKLIFVKEIVVENNKTASKLKTVITPQEIKKEPLSCTK